MIGCEAHARRRPVLGADPAPAMIEMTTRCARAAAAAHDEDAHRRLVERRVLHDMVEEAQAVGAPVAAPGIDRRVGAEIDVAEHAVAAIAVGPRPEDQPLWSAPGGFQPEIIAGRRQRVGIVPRRHVDAGRAAVAFVETLGPDAELLPERVELAVRPLLEEIGFVIGMVAQRRMAGFPRHAREPLDDILRLERRAQHRIGFGFRREDRLLVRPGRLLQLECAGLADAAAPGIAEPARIEHLRDEARRIEAAERGLGVRGVGEAHRADAPVAPILPHDPGAGVEPVLAVRQIFDEAPLGAVPAARVLEHHGVAVPGEVAGEVIARDRVRIGRGELAPAQLGAAVRRALENDGEGADAVREMHIRGKPDAIAHRRHLRARIAYLVHAGTSASSRSTLKARSSTVCGCRARPARRSSAESCSTISPPCITPIIGQRCATTARLWLTRM